MDEKPPVRNSWGQASLALGIPTLMVSGPLVGYFLALGAIKLFGIEPPWNQRTIFLGLMLGIATSMRETVRVIRRIRSKS